MEGQIYSFAPPSFSQEGGCSWHPESAAPDGAAYYETNLLAQFKRGSSFSLSYHKPVTELIRSYLNSSEQQFKLDWSVDKKDWV